MCSDESGLERKGKERRSKAAQITPSGKGGQQGGPTVVILAPKRPRDWYTIAELERVYFVEGSRRASPLHSNAVYSVSRVATSRSLLMLMMPPGGLFEKRTLLTILFRRDVRVGVRARAWPRACCVFVSNLTWIRLSPAEGWGRLQCR